MAAMATDPPLPISASGSGSATESLPMPSHNPLPLSASQEAQVRDVYHRRVREFCAPEIKAFAACASGRTFSVPFACRDSHRGMNACMKKHATREEMDRAREEWFAGRVQRAREKEAKARRKAEQEAFLREWWGLPERDREERRKEEERMMRGERIGGFRARERGEGEGKR